MPAGTDSVLLGSWFNLSRASHILDAGCGTGLLALMVAQRQPAAKILAVDKNEKAAEIADYNVNQSQWKDRISVQEMDIFSLEAQNTALFSHIVCNPPYFTSGTQSPSRSRSSFRHTQGQFFDSFFPAVHTLSLSKASLGMVLPFSMRDQICVLALSYGWYVRSELLVRHTAKSELNLCLLEWSKLYNEGSSDVSQLILYDENGKKTPAYNNLTQAFYL